MKPARPRAAGTHNDAARRMHLLRGVAQLLSSDAPVAELLPRCSAPIAALLDAGRVLVALRDADRDALVFDSHAGGRPADDAIAAGSVAADVLERGETIARSGDDASSSACRSVSAAGCSERSCSKASRPI
jgi:hypothetical protein